MIIHCLACGKCVSSHQLACPYCKAEITDTVLETNGVEMKPRMAEKIKMGFLQALARR